MADGVDTPAGRVRALVAAAVRAKARLSAEAFDALAVAEFGIGSGDAAETERAFAVLAAAGTGMTDPAPAVWPPAPDREALARVARGAMWPHMDAQWDRLSQENKGVWQGIVDAVLAADPIRRAAARLVERAVFVPDGGELRLVAETEDYWVLVEALGGAGQEESDG